MAVHSYQTIDRQIVYAICRNDLDDFKRFARALETRL
ncbi:MAG: HepT-like ribonuclease domain-containing protein [Pseudomonadota bacterium]